jgi:hypothetical protein
LEHGFPFAEEASMRPTSLLFAMALGLCACASSRVVTTPAPVPAAGSDIRYALRSAPYHFTSGRLISLDADTLTFERRVRGGPGAWATDHVPTDSIAQLQALVGGHSNAVRGTLIGAGIGLAIGGLCAIRANEDESSLYTPGSCMASGLVSGALTGVLIGALSRTNVWAPVPLPRPGPSESPMPPVTATVEPDDIVR